MSTLKKQYRDTLGGKESLGAAGQKSKKQKTWASMTKDQKDLAYDLIMAQYRKKKSKNKTYPKDAKTIDEKRKEKKSIINKIKKIAKYIPIGPPPIGILTSAGKIISEKVKTKAKGGLIKGYNKGGHITTKGWGKARKT